MNIANLFFALPTGLQMIWSIILLSPIIYTAVREIFNSYYFWQRGHRKVSKQQKVDIERGTDRNYIDDWFVKRLEGI